ncbi:hypothetical protein BDB00DRAFT_934191 [Zychaea mexicana]|uniref:uncharacterized protein n=1 Tax=Zychaea mexicana TaxID=64656 RepID=UPI0022FEA41E|nr:uncharacterized protein BDB00DRAFT_934191 [Zychaea mexicana]KAI9474870.1 hypothetical protein BDB00DRAFT_934191 [Zychaea mexicana]
MDFDGEGFGSFMATTPRTFPQGELTDVRGKRVNVRQLAEDYLLVLITLKKIECPVCPQLLKILNLYGLEPDENKYVDPFTHRVWEIEPDRKKFFRLLLKRDAYFIVLCPGDEDQVAQIQQQTPFMHYPFIAGEQALLLGQSLKISMSDSELWPAILEVEPGTLATKPISIGRGPGQYYHMRLLQKLFIERCRLEMQGIEAMAEAWNLIDQQKRRIVKCREKKLAGYNLSLLPQLPPPSPPTPPPQPLLRKSTERPPSEKGGDDTEADGATAPCRPLHDVLPPEVLDIVLSFTPDTRALVKAARTSRIFYMTSCNVIIARLRESIQRVQLALPKKDGHALADEDETVSMGLNRWHQDPEGIGYRELQRRMSALKAIVADVSKWTRHWSPRKIRRTPPRSFGTPVEI